MLYSIIAYALITVPGKPAVARVVVHSAKSKLAGMVATIEGEQPSNTELPKPVNAAGSVMDVREAQP